MYISQLLVESWQSELLHHILCNYFWVLVSIERVLWRWRIREVYLDVGFLRAVFIGSLREVVLLLLFKLI